MPFYQVFHSVALTDDQKDALAKGITAAHCDVTGALKLFVTVEFYENTNPWQYVGGQRRPNNKIIGMTRPRGEGNTLMDVVVDEIKESWDSIVGNNGEKELTAVWINASMITGLEFGLPLPKAFEDGEWFEKYKSVLGKRATSGDPLFVEAMRDSIISRI